MTRCLLDLNCNGNATMYSFLKRGEKPSWRNKTFLPCLSNNRVHAKFTKTRPRKLKSIVKKGTKVTLRLSSGMFGNDKISIISITASKCQRQISWQPR